MRGNTERREDKREEGRGEQTWTGQDTIDERGGRKERRGNDKKKQGEERNGNQEMKRHGIKEREKRYSRMGRREEQEGKQMET